jgi:hypothetical protein
MTDGTDFSMGINKQTRADSKHELRHICQEAESFEGEMICEQTFT